MQPSQCDNYTDVIEDMRDGDECDQNLVGVLNDFIHDSLYTDGDNCDEPLDTPTPGIEVPQVVEKSSDESMQIVDVVEPGTVSKVESDDKLPSDRTVIDRATGQNIPAGQIDTAGLEYVGIFNVPQSGVNTNVPQSQLVTLDETKLVLIVNNGTYAEKDYFLIKEVNQHVSQGNESIENMNVQNPGQEAVGNISANEGGVMKPKGTKSTEGTLYTLKAVVESDMEEEKENKARHSADDCMKVRNDVEGRRSKECKTDSELERFGLLKYNIGDPREKSPVADKSGKGDDKTQKNTDEMRNKETDTKQTEDSDQLEIKKEMKVSDEAMKNHVKGKKK